MPVAGGVGSPRRGGGALGRHVDRVGEPVEGVDDGLAVLVHVAEGVGLLFLITSSKRAKEKMFLSGLVALVFISSVSARFSRVKSALASERTSDQGSKLSSSVARRVMRLMFFTWRKSSLSQSFGSAVMRGKVSSTT